MSESQWKHRSPSEASAFASPLVGAGAAERNRTQCLPSNLES